MRSIGGASPAAGRSLAGPLEIERRSIERQLPAGPPARQARPLGPTSGSQRSGGFLLACPLAPLVTSARECQHLARILPAGLMFLWLGQNKNLRLLAVNVTRKRVGGASVATPRLATRAHSSTTKVRNFAKLNRSETGKRGAPPLGAFPFTFVFASALAFSRRRRRRRPHIAHCTWHIAHLVSRIAHRIHIEGSLSRPERHKSNQRAEST